MFSVWWGAAFHFRWLFFQCIFMAQRWTDVFVHTCVCTRGGQRSTSVIFSHSPPYFFGTGSFIESGDFLSWTNQKVPGIFLSHPSPSTWCAPLHHALLHECQGSELKISWLHGKHFTDQAISLTPWDLLPKGMTLIYRVLSSWSNHHPPNPHFLMLVCWA